MADDRISGRVALVTGGARGIGRAITEALLRAGGTVALADVDADAAADTAVALSPYGPVHAFSLDVTDPRAFVALVDRVEEEMGPVDILVNNAGIMPVGAFEELPPDVDRQQVEVNLFGVIHGTRAVLPHMRRRGRGHIVNLASLAGRMGVPGIAVYSATKHAVIGLTEALRHELADDGISLTYVMPAFVRTDLIAGAPGPRFPPPVAPEEVARAVLRALRTREVDVYVPRIGRLSQILPALLPRRFYEALGKRAFRLDQAFASIDGKARSAYRARVFGAAAKVG